MLILLLISFGSTSIGALFGISGGVIIRPTMDLVGQLDIAVVQFLSSTTVLAMSTYSVTNGLLSKSERLINLRTTTPLGVSAAIGGTSGALIFRWLLNGTNTARIQSLSFVIVIGCTFIFFLFKQKIVPRKLEQNLFGLPIGLVLGMISGFLGIGGGPINLAVLFYFYGMDAKAAAQNSLCIIFISQLFNLLANLVLRTIPPFEMHSLALMIAGGICGGIVGRWAAKRFSTRTADRLPVIITGLVLAIGLVNLLT